MRRILSLILLSLAALALLAAGYVLGRATPAGGPDTARLLATIDALSATPGPPLGVTQTITLAAAPAFPPEINPLRGYYSWRGDENVPSPDPLPEPSLDHYERYEWRELEPRPGEYDFSAIDREIARAAERGGRLGFRVRALVDTEERAVPDYLIEQMDRGWTTDFRGRGRVYVPDWNDPDFLERAERLMLALGERYNGDPRVSFVDIGMFGMWGEWHIYPLSYPSPSGAAAMTAENRRRLVDMHLAAFPDKHLVMMTDDEETLLYALRQSPRVGWRRDSLGEDHFNTIFRKLRRMGDEELALLSERWKTAPVVTEFFNPSRHIVPDSYLLTAEQVRRYHISLVSNGNAAGWRQLDEAGRAALLLAGANSGYRYRPLSVALPATALPGGDFPVGSRWRNIGNAPTYEEWRVVWQLRAADGALAWEGVSSLDLRAVLPPDPPLADVDDTAFRPAEDWQLAIPTPVPDADPAAAVAEHSDRFTLPAALAPGSYRLTLEVRDAAGYSRPMRLAVDTPHADGVYELGEVVIGQP